jgi:uncharacterized protein (TIGR00106 family)
MLAQFTVYPMDETHLSKDVAQMMEVLDKEDVKYCLSPMATAVEGSWQQVLSAIRKCHVAMRERHARVITTITIDDSREQAHHLDEIVPIVEAQLGHKAKQDGKRLVVSDLQ